jgi:hypothetical protein
MAWCDLGFNTFNCIFIPNTWTQNLVSLKDLFTPKLIFTGHRLGVVFSWGDFSSMVSVDVHFLKNAFGVVISISFFPQGLVVQTLVYVVIFSKT